MLRYNGYRHRIYSPEENFRQILTAMKHPRKHFTYITLILYLVGLYDVSAAAPKCSGNTIIVGGKSACVGSMSPSEANRATHEYNSSVRNKELRYDYERANQAVKDGFDPNVSLEEFRRRLDYRSDIHRQLNGY